MSQWDGGRSRPDGSEVHLIAGGARRFGGADLVLVAAFLALLFIAFDDFTAGAAPASAAMAPTGVRLEQVCSEQELRHMRAGIDSCFDEITPGPEESGGNTAREPAARVFAGS